jgi:large subunit ribosomal protein L27
MAHKKAAGTTKNGRDSQPKYLGFKISDGGMASVGSIIVRQRGSKFLPGSGAAMGRDYTIFSLKKGKVKIGSKRKVRFDGSIITKKTVNVI